MCYRVSRDFTDVDVKADTSFGVGKVNASFDKSYNVTITQKLPVIVPGSRVLDMFRWGLIPHWAKDETIGAKLGNARAETLSEKPSFRVSYKNKRCLVLVSGFYEWNAEKQPYHIKLKNEKIYALAGLWDSWKREDGTEIKTVTIITTVPNKFISKLHERMPVIIDKDDYETWLTSSDMDEIEKLLMPYPDKKMHIDMVTKKVNFVKNNSKDLLEPLKEIEFDSESQKKLF